MMEESSRQVIAILPAGGQGQRMGGKKGKLLLPLGGEPILAATLQALNLSEIEAIFIPVSIVARDEIEEIIHTRVCQRGLAAKITLCAGGPTRQESVFSGLQAAKEWDGWRVPEEKRIVVIHDAARPLVDETSINLTIEAAAEVGGAALGVPVKDTIKVVKDGYIQTTPPRNTLWSVQTPQVFTWPVIWKAHAHAKEIGFTGTDDASLVEEMKSPVRLVKGSYKNIKITTPEDLQFAQLLYVGGHGRRLATAYMEDPSARIRVGQGYDVHRLVKGRPLILGGVRIPYEFGLEGHSDADVAIHAVIDALLGAAGLGDIGELFPDTDRQYKDIESGIFLKKVLSLLEEEEMTVLNIDLTVIAQQPKLAGYRRQIRENLAGIFGITVEDISVKATTTEGLGFTGRGEGIAAQAVVLVKKFPVCLDV